MQYKKQVSLTILYIVCLLALFFTRSVAWGSGEFIFKPLLMPILAWFYYLNISKSPMALFDKLILVALFFSWWGDVFLMFETRGEIFFLLGLAAFLLAHLAYLWAFKISYRLPEISYLKKRPLLILPFVLLVVLFIYLVKTNLKEMFVPVVFYASVIAAMALMALSRFQNVPVKSFQLVFAGALIFIASDLLIGLNKFYKAIPYAGMWIMTLYCLGQYLIVWGSLKQFDR